jgi:hypothetical protein
MPLRMRSASVRGWQADGDRVRAGDRHQEAVVQQVLEEAGDRRAHLDVGSRDDGVLGDAVALGKRTWQATGSRIRRRSWSPSIG